MRRSVRDTGPSLEVVMAVLHRDGYRCIRDGVPIVGERGWDWSIHHRRPRGAGGTSRTDANEPQNLVAVCGSGTTGCHGFIESNRNEAREHGWIVPLHIDPLRVAVLVDHGSRWTYLSSDAQYVDHPEAS